VEVPNGDSHPSRDQAKDAPKQSAKDLSGKCEELSIRVGSIAQVFHGQVQQLQAAHIQADTVAVWHVD
jgi:hypothetical protein